MQIQPYSNWIIATGFEPVKNKSNSFTVWVTNTGCQSPAWEAGMRNRRAIIKVNGNKKNASAFNELIASLNKGNKTK